LFKLLLSLVPAGLTVDQILPSPDHIVLLARPQSRAAACPLCDRPSTRVHSRYSRRLADLPWHGRIVELQVDVRRFRCSNGGCRRRIFAERLPEVAALKARRTARLREAQRHIGLTLGGEPGARLARRLAMPVSGDTLLRLIRAVALEPPAVPRVLGVDDWAWRRGQRYGTILCDLERRRVIDLLPDRQAETLAAWLERHPGVEVVSRDRAGAYADGIRQGAPQAVQVADRWHLLRNGSDALRQVLDRHPAQLRQAARAVTAELDADVAPPEPRPPTKLEQGQRDRYAKRQARFDEIARLHQQGLGARAIARTPGLARSTVRRWLRRGQTPTWRKGRRPSIVDPYADHLRRRWREGCRNAAQLWREIRAQGFPGQAVIVRQWVARLRAGDAAAVPTGPARPVWRTPSSRQAARLLLADAESLHDTERAFAGALTAASPAIRAARELAGTFAGLVKARDAAGLEPWLEAAQGSALGGFADGLRRDLPAVRAALTTPWSTGPVEGHITRLKLLKRQMYGRAKFDLLRRRVLCAA
jgi:transposase